MQDERHEQTLKKTQQPVISIFGYRLSLTLCMALVLKTSTQETLAKNDTASAWCQVNCF